MVDTQNYCGKEPRIHSTMNNVAYWNKYSQTYLSEWTKNGSRKRLDQLESDFIQQSITTSSNVAKNRVYLDIGCGPGRIINVIKSIDPTYSKIVGIDNNEGMFRICAKRYAVDSRVSILKKNVLNVNHIKVKADVITAIRVLKYIRQRNEIFRMVAALLKPGGIFIFTVTNRISIAFFDRLPIVHYKDTEKEITRMLSEAGLRVSRVEGHQRFPEFLYSVMSYVGLFGLLYLVEAKLHNIIGSTGLARTLYFVAEKNNE